MQKKYSITEVSKITGKSRQWIWFLIQTRRLEAEKIANVYIISEESLKGYLDNQQKEK